MDWNELSAEMDAAVDDALGDAISVSMDAGSSWATHQGFVLPYSRAGTIEGFDEPLGSRSRVKLPRDLFSGGVPGRSVRVMHARLGSGSFRPCGSDPEDQGRYVLFDVQKA